MRAPTIRVINPIANSTAPIVIPISKGGAPLETKIALIPKVRMPMPIITAPVLIVPSPGPSGDA